MRYLFNPSYSLAPMGYASFLVGYEMRMIFLALYYCVPFNVGTKVY